MMLQYPPEKQFESLVAAASLNVCGLISDMVVRLRTSLVTKRALLTTNEWDITILVTSND